MAYLVAFRPTVLEPSVRSVCTQHCDDVRDPELQSSYSYLNFLSPHPKPLNPKPPNPKPQTPKPLNP